MPILSFGNPRNRATVIAVLLVMEFLAVLWLRESSPNEGPIHTPFRSVASGRDRHHVGEERSLRHQEYHLLRMQLEQRRQEEQVYTGAGAGAETMIKSEGMILQSRSETGPDVPYKSIERKESNTETPHGLPRQEEQHQQHQHHPDQSTGEGDISSSSAIPNLLPSIYKSEQKETTTVVNINNIIQTSKASSHADKSTKTVKIKKARGSRNKHHSSHAHAKNPRGGFKTTKERKLAQLIPVLDEHGEVIEDHFVSPRDMDGDGVPDIYVLLRPTANSKYMMDVGLFDEEAAPPPPPAQPAPTAPATSSQAILILSATSAVSAAASSTIPTEPTRSTAVQQ